MERFELDPLTDPRWDDFVQRHRQSSIFHTAGWLNALRRTYGYQPVAMTTCPPDAALHNAVLFCRVDSWLTGRRLVSLPFSDHCDLLADASDRTILCSLRRDMHNKRLRYIELRPPTAVEPGEREYHAVDNYFWHRIDLSPNLDTLLSNCHKDSVQRKIRRAEREGLTLQEGDTASTLDSFYSLLLLTRRRHRLPPQPKKWFLNLIDCLGTALKIRVAWKNRQPIAAILTLRHRNVLMYKYGCSDPTFHNLGGMQLLLWKSIQEAKEAGMSMFDLGRSDCEDQGLITFKDRWGAQRCRLTYLRCSASAPSRKVSATLGEHSTHGTVRTLLSCLPDPLLRAAASLLYKHAG